MTQNKPGNDSFAAVDQLLDELYPQMEADLLGLLQFPSVKEEALPGQPFGRPIAEALDYCLQLSAKYGLVTENVDGYMGAADISGPSAEAVGILSHIDVVPASPADWRYHPFQPQVVDGRIYGRGTLDDKGPLIASLYAGLALSRSNLPLNKTIRFLYGCDEESGFSCIQHYLSKRTPPVCGFSPDGSFPLVIGEKGMAHYQLSSNWPTESGSLALSLISLEAGTVSNVIPQRAEAVLQIQGNPPALPECGEGISTQQENGRLIITANGTAAHASAPEEGDNAIAKLLQYLVQLDYQPAGAKQYLDTLAKLFQECCYGETLGVADQDAHSQLTNVPSVLKVSADQGMLECDMRFTVTRSAAYFQQKLTEIARQNNLQLATWEAHEPLLGDPNQEPAHSLLKAYRDFTGDLSEPMIMGGGTYAKSVPNFLAFGPCFATTAGVIHKADEYLECDEWLRTAKIYARAIYGLAK